MKLTEFEHRVHLQWVQGEGDYLPTSTPAHALSEHQTQYASRACRLKALVAPSSGETPSSALREGPILSHCGCWKIVEGECVLESVHLQRVEGTPCQSGGCSHTEGSESLRSGSCIIESEVTACGGPATGAEQPSCRSAARSSSQLLPLRRPRP